MNIYCASFDPIRISGAENKLSRKGVGVGGDCENKANSAQLGLAGALAEFGNMGQLCTLLIKKNFLVILVVNICFNSMHQ